jgi:hypothetical protein
MARKSGSPRHDKLIAPTLQKSSQTAQPMLGVTKTAAQTVARVSNKTNASRKGK